MKTSRLYLKSISMGGIGLNEIPMTTEQKTVYARIQAIESEMEKLKSEQIKAIKHAKWLGYLKAFDDLMEISMQVIGRDEFLYELKDLNELINNYQEK